MAPRRGRMGRTTGNRRWCRSVALVALVVALPSLSVGFEGVASARGTGGRGVHEAANPATNWTTYHANPIESGIAPGSFNFSHPVRAWTSEPLEGQLFGEPLVEGNLVVVATESDVVYALNAATGATVWSTTVGTAVPSGDLPCGDISPTVGITSTPVIDPALSEIFVVADEIAGATISHELVALDLATGHIELQQDVDPPGTTPAAQLQRPGLALDHGSVLIAFGGNAGDCSTYHGWVESVPESGGTASFFEVDPSPGNDQGAVWLGGAAPVVDGNGDVWVASGNGSNTTGTDPDYGDSVVELSPSMSVLQSFTPTTWRTDNASDFDLGSSAPVVMGDGLTLQVGKSQTAYLLNTSHLGGVGGQVAEKSICGTVNDGGSAFTSTVRSSVAYIPCLNGVEAVKLTKKTRGDTIRVLWQTKSGSSGPPILVGKLIWTIDLDGTLYGLHKGNGSVAVKETIGSIANHFPTPSVGAGLLLAPTADQVVAFK